MIIHTGEKIESCPKCGERYKIICDIKYDETYATNIKKYYAITCLNCFTSTRYYKKRERAISAWNKRESVTK